VDAFLHPRCPRSGARPDRATLPPGVRIIDATVDPLGEVAHRIRNAETDYLAVHDREDGVGVVAGRQRGVRAESEDVALIDPRVIGRFSRSRGALEAGAGDRIEAPALRAIVAQVGTRPVERAFALLAVERSHLPAGGSNPHHP